jgi:NAD(P)-dependent dehydrogenase (short-subunit alcohol dehydrogenase family)
MDFAGSLAGKTALVTGASRGIGRGIAVALADAGARVYATGRSIDSATLPDAVTRIACDHNDDEAVAQVFGRIQRECGGRLDVLANAVWGGYERMVENGKFTWGIPFWEQPLWRWSAMMDAGVRAGYVASQHAARLMVPARGGVIAHLSHWAARKRLGNVIYGIAKAATDTMVVQTADELRAHNVTVVSLYPGLVRTEAVLAAGVFDLSNSESPEFIGRAIAAMAVDPQAQRWNGKVVTAAAVALDYGFTDIDGAQPRPLTDADV